jgi:hypothetical protein
MTICNIQIFTNGLNLIKSNGIFSINYKRYPNKTVDI